MNTRRIVLSGSAIINDGKLLLLRKIKNSTYEFPGGTVESGETIEEHNKTYIERMDCLVCVARYYSFHRNHPLFSTKRSA